MGASDWEYVVPLRSTVTETLIALQQQLIESGDFYWDLQDEETGEDLPRPTSLAQLAEYKERDEFWDVGTHSALDLDRVVNTDDEDHDGTLRPLSTAEAREYLGSERPTAADFAHAYGTGSSGSLEPITARRWSGRCVLLHEGDQPTAVGIWGFSGD